MTSSIVEEMKYGVGGVGLVGGVLDVDLLRKLKESLVKEEVTRINYLYELPINVLFDALVQLLSNM